MDERYKRINELEERILSEKKELDKMLLNYSGNSDFYMANKLKFLQSEIDVMLGQINDLTAKIGSDAQKYRETSNSRPKERVLLDRTKTNLVADDAAAAAKVKEESTETVKKAVKIISTVDNIRAEDKKEVIEPVAEVEKVEEVVAAVEKAEESSAIVEKIEEPVAAIEKSEEPVAAVEKVEEPVVPIEEFEVEETIEIKEIPVVHEEKEAKKKVSFENKIGLMVMPILAAVLIFVSVVLFANALPEAIGNILKQITMFLAGGTFVGTGLVLHKKKKGGAFGQVLMSIGLGELFVSLVVCRFVFKSLNDVFLFVMIFLWASGIILLKNVSNALFQTIGEIGVAIAVIFGVAYSLSVDKDYGLVIIFTFYLFSTLLYYVLYKIVKGKFYNAVIFHSFNWLKLTVLIIGFSKGIGIGLLGMGSGCLILAALTLISCIDVIVTKRESMGGDIFCGIMAPFYVFNILVGAAKGMLYLMAQISGFSALQFDISYMTDWFDNGQVFFSSMSNLYWIILTVPALMLTLIALIVEFARKNKVVRYLVESIVLTTVLIMLFFSPETFKIGFVLLIALSTVIGYSRKNPVYKLAALITYVLYATMPHSDILRIVVGLGYAILSIVLIYAAKKQYNLGIKICVYFALILYSCMVTISMTQNSSIYGLRMTIITTFVSMLNLMMMFTSLSKNKEKKDDFSYIAESVNILLIPTVLLSAMMIIKEGNMGYYMYLLGFLLMLVAVFRGFLQNRILCKAAVLLSLITGLAAFWNLKYSAIVMGTILIALFLILLYSVKEKYNVIYKAIIHIIALGYALLDVLYFKDALKNLPGFGAAVVILVAMLAVNYLFMFTDLSRNANTDEKDFRISTFCVNCLLALYSLILICANRDNNLVPSLVFAVIMFVWILHGFLADYIEEKLAAIIQAFLMMTVCWLWFNATYTAVSIIFVVLYLFMLYKKEDGYETAVKYTVLAIALINSAICPLLFAEYLNEALVLVTGNVVFLGFFIIHTLIRYTPISSNPDTDENDTSLFASILKGTLIFYGLITAAANDSPADSLAALMIIALLPMGALRIWRRDWDEEDDNTGEVVLRYVAITEYIFVPIIMCYTLSAPNYVSSIIGLVLTIGCIVLGFVIKRKGIRLYGLAVSMLMVFKLALIDLELSSLMAYAVSFFIAGLSCVVISMIYYFVNAAVSNRE